MRSVEFLRYRDVLLPGERLPLTVIARSIDESRAARILPLRRRDSNPAPPGTVPVWVSEAAVDLRHLNPGDVFELPLADRVVRAERRGVWRDYDRPGGAVVLDRHRYLDLSGDRNATTAAVSLSVASMRRRSWPKLRRPCRGTGITMWPGPHRFAASRWQLFDRTFAVTYVLEAVAVLIGLFGVSASMQAQVLARRGEFGMLRHVGVTRGEIARMLALEGAALGAIGVGAGLVVGALISLVLIFVVNRQSFHWTMDLHVPWALLAVLSTLLVAAAAGTAAFSGRRAMGEDVVRAVREDW